MSASHPKIQVAGRNVAVDVPHLIFATGLAGWCAWFCRDAWRSSPEVENLILIVPVSAIAVILYFFIAAGCFRLVDDTAEREAPARKPLAPGVGMKVAGSMTLLAAFVIAGPLIGFDVAAFVYVFAMMAFLGERRVVALLVVPLLFCVTAIYCFNNLLSTPLPLLFVHNS